MQAVDEVSCVFRSGEIHAVCGENGAGKSTLLKIASGMFVPDSGEVVVGGTVLEPHTPSEGIERGIAMVLQHFALVPVFTVFENIVLGAEPTNRLGVLERKAARAKIEAIARDLGTELPLDTPIEDLGVGDRQRVEIARALFRDARLIILDEPTAVLTKTEASALYATLRRLADQPGKGIVVVTHKMDEVRAHADVVSVMRRGKLLFTEAIDREGAIDVQIERVTSAIMGAVTRRARDELASSARLPPSPEPVLVVEGLETKGGLVSTSFKVHAGEIVGIAGVEGGGQTDLVAVLSGEIVPSGGVVKAESIAIVREDRQREGLVLDGTLRDNLVLGELGRFTRWGFVDLAALEAEAARRLAHSGAGAGLDRTARSLSGGNQQKIVVARAIARAPKVLVAAQPTRGVDLAASLDIHADLVAAASGGAGVLVISADLDELRKVAARILVITRGRIVADLPPTASDEEIGRLMLGLAEKAGAAPAPSAPVARSAPSAKGGSA